MKYRSFIRKILLNILANFSSPKNGIHILNAHFIAKFSERSEIFFELIDALSKEVDFINIQEASNLILNKSFNINDKLVAFTFDDGFEECYTKIKPTLDYFDIKAAFFVNPNFIEGDKTYIENFINNVVYLDGYKLPMSWEQLSILKKEGHIIGAHTMDHLSLNISKTDILEYQILECKRSIENHLGGTCDYFAYPYGKLDDISENAIALASNNFKFNFTQSNHKKYFSFNEQFINRRHFEGNWPVGHLKYFLGKKTF